MANTIDRLLIIPGPKTYVSLFTIIGDGSGEATNVRINVVSGDMGLTPRLMRIESSFSGFSGRVSWDATSPIFIQQLVSDYSTKLNYDHRGWGTGGIYNTAGAGKTGDLILTTSGLGDGDSGHIIIYVHM
jgi:hypothetical protein